MSPTVAQLGADWESTFDRDEALVDVDRLPNYGFDSGVGLPADSVGQIQPDDGDDVPQSVGQFRDWQADNPDKQHAYSRRKADERYAKVKDVGRFFASEYETFSTVLLTYCAERRDGESIAEHARRFYPEAVTRKRRRILKSLGVWNDFAGLSLLAPKHADDSGCRVPGAKSTTTHAHDFYWIPGTVSRSDFEGLVDLHVKHVDGATDALNPREKAVSVRTHDSSEVTTPESVATRGADIDFKRGATTSLAHEVGNNLALLQTRHDARVLPEYAEEWCAELCLGSDGDPTTSGVSRFKQWGRFQEIADGEAMQRRVEEWVTGGWRIEAKLWD